MLPSPSLIGRAAIAVALTFLATCRPSPTVGRSAAAAAPARPLAARTPPADLEARARQLARTLIIADGHVDVPHRLELTLRPDGSLGEDVAAATGSGDFDWPRAVAGGLDAPFMSIYVPAELAAQPTASRRKADQLIDRVEAIIRAAPDKFAPARTPDEVMANSARGLISLPLGIENGSALEDLASVRHFHDRGVRYVTLTHARHNALGDSSYGEGTERRWNGLSPFGRQVVAEMNRVGIMVDLAHVSDETFRQAVALSAVPVIASHSSARRFTPGFERNPSDDLIRALAARGGVIMVNFGSRFLRADSRATFESIREATTAFAAARALTRFHPEVKAFEAAWQRDHPPVFATVADVAAHIDHIVALVGIDHVGLGSDFDGVGDSMPVGLKDVSQYPNLFAELLRRGYSEGDLAKIAAGNLFRVWRAAEAFARPR